MACNSCGKNRRAGAKPIRTTIRKTGGSRTIRTHIKRGK